MARRMTRIPIAAIGIRRKLLEIIDLKNMTKASAAPNLKSESTRVPASLLPSPQGETSFRFSGHQTFPLRIAWIPKAVSELVQGRDPLTNFDEGITKLGLGKDMVEALRCWIEAFQIANRVDGHWSLTIGKFIFQSEEGLDPYLEDVSTSWLLHWLITTNTHSPFFAWECLFNRWPAMEFVLKIIEAFEIEAHRTPKSASIVTLRQHWEVFLHSYRPPRSEKGEDHLDSAMSALRLIREFGERPNASGKWESLYSLIRAANQRSQNNFSHSSVHDWWNRKYPTEQTTPLERTCAWGSQPGRLQRCRSLKYFNVSR